MRWLAKFRSTLRWLLRRGRAETELDDELRYHCEREIENNLRAGMPLEEAKLAAERLFGPVSLYKEECRDARGASLIENFMRDLRYAARMFRRTPVLRWSRSARWPSASARIQPSLHLSRAFFSVHCRFAIHSS
jgi:putative ABC transport system permease protein